MRVFWRVSLFQPPPNRQLSIPHAQHSAESRGRFVRCTLDSRPTTFHKQNISYLHSAWMYSGPEHRDNRGKSETDTSRIPALAVVDNGRSIMMEDQVTTRAPI